MAWPGTRSFAMTRNQTSAHGQRSDPLPWSGIRSYAMISNNVLCHDHDQVLRRDQESDPMPWPEIRSSTMIRIILYVNFKTEVLQYLYRVTCPLPWSGIKSSAIVSNQILCHDLESNPLSWSEIRSNAIIRNKSSAKGSSARTGVHTDTRTYSKNIYPYFSRHVLYWWREWNFYLWKMNTVSDWPDIFLLLLFST
jgi:hypothetical protein